MAWAPSEDSDQPGHLQSLIRVFAVRMKKPWVLSYPLSAQRRLWWDWVDAQAEVSLPWAHMSFCWFCHEEAHLPKYKLPSQVLMSFFEHHYHLQTLTEKARTTQLLFLLRSCTNAIYQILYLDQWNNNRYKSS